MKEKEEGKHSRFLCVVRAIGSKGGKKSDISLASFSAPCKRAEQKKRNKSRAVAVAVVEEKRLIFTSVRRARVALHTTRLPKKPLASQPLLQPLNLPPPFLPFFRAIMGEPYTLPSVSGPKETITTLLDTSILSRFANLDQVRRRFLLLFCPRNSVTSFF